MAKSNWKLSRSLCCQAALNKEDKTWHGIRQKLWGGGQLAECLMLSNGYGSRAWGDCTDSGNEYQYFQFGTATTWDTTLALVTRDRSNNNFTITPHKDLFCYTWQGATLIKDACPKDVAYTVPINNTYQTALITPSEIL